VWSGVRLVTALAWWSRLATLASLPLRSYLVVSALIWLSVSLFLFWNLVRGSYIALPLTAIAAASFSIWFWIDRWLMAKPAANWGFILGVTVLSIICVILCVRHQRTKQFFIQRERYEDESKN
jgi:hypothetical protein